MDENEKDLKIQELQEKTAELENNWKRALADYRNLVKRTEEERTNYMDFAASVTVKSLIPVLDNLEMLNKHITDAGLKMIVKDFNQVLHDEGLMEIEAEGKEFDPMLMEAIEMVPGEKDIVVEVLNKGYLLKDKLVRPARVRVGQGKE